MIDHLDGIGRRKAAVEHAIEHPETMSRGARMRQAEKEVRDQALEIARLKARIRELESEVKRLRMLERAA